ncbi:hypothetical protein ACFSJY_13055 [Thalassotalea euphylliae]|uniref:hypothetical protein n=1 Tax=Thalassotalea euphylliae TaxID=1655234 RepID=UPI003642C68D
MRVTKGLMLLFVSCSSMAMECTRPVLTVFTGYSTSDSKIHVEHGDGYSASIVDLEFVSKDAKAANDILATLLLAHKDGKPVKFKYAQRKDGNELSCKPKKSQQVLAVSMI